MRTSSARLSQLLALRQHMGHLVTHLQVYLQQDVVESSYSQLMERIAAAQVPCLRAVPPVMNRKLCVCMRLHATVAYSSRSFVC